MRHLHIQCRAFVFVSAAGLLALPSLTTAETLLEQRQREEREAAERWARPTPDAGSPHRMDPAALKALDQEIARSFIAQIRNRMQSASTRKTACSARYSPSAAANARGAVAHEAAKWNALMQECERSGAEKFLASDTAKAAESSAAKSTQKAATQHKAAERPPPRTDGSNSAQHAPNPEKSGGGEKSAQDKGRAPKQDPNRTTGTTAAAKSRADQKTAPQSPTAVLPVPAQTWKRQDLATPSAGTGSASPPPAAQAWQRQDLATPVGANGAAPTSPPSPAGAGASQPKHPPAAHTTQAQAATAKSDAKAAASGAQTLPPQTWKRADVTAAVDGKPPPVGGAAPGAEKKADGEGSKSPLQIAAGGAAPRPLDDPPRTGGASKPMDPANPAGASSTRTASSEKPPAPGGAATSSTEKKAEGEAPKAAPTTAVAGAAPQPSDDPARTGGASKPADPANPAGASSTRTASSEKPPAPGGAATSSTEKKAEGEAPKAAPTTAIAGAAPQPSDDPARTGGASKPMDPANPAGASSTRTASSEKPPASGGAPASSTEKKAEGDAPKAVPTTAAAGAAPRPADDPARKGRAPKPTDPANPAGASSTKTASNEKPPAPGGAATPSTEKRADGAAKPTAPAEAWKRADVIAAASSSTGSGAVPKGLTEPSKKSKSEPPQTRDAVDPAGRPGKDGQGLNLGNVPVEVIGKVPEELKKLSRKERREKPLDQPPIKIQFVGVPPADLKLTEASGRGNVPGLSVTPATGDTRMTTPPQKIVQDLSAPSTLSTPFPSPNSAHPPEISHRELKFSLRDSGTGLSGQRGESAAERTLTDPSARTEIANRELRGGQEAARTGGGLFGGMFGGLGRMLNGLFGSPAGTGSIAPAGQDAPMENRSPADAALAARGEGTVRATGQRTGQATTGAAGPQGAANATATAAASASTGGTGSGQGFFGALGQMWTGVQNFFGAGSAGQSTAIASNDATQGARSPSAGQRGSSTPRLTGAPTHPQAMGVPGQGSTSFAGSPTATAPPTGRSAAPAGGGNQGAAMAQRQSSSRTGSPESAARMPGPQGGPGRPQGQASSSTATSGGAGLLGGIFSGLASFAQQLGGYFRSGTSQSAQQGAGQQAEALAFAQAPGGIPGSGATGKQLTRRDRARGDRAGNGTTDTAVQSGTPLASPGDAARTRGADGGAGTGSPGGGFTGRGSMSTSGGTQPGGTKQQGQLASGGATGGEANAQSGSMRGVSGGGEKGLPGGNAPSGGNQLAGGPEGIAGGAGGGPSGVGGGAGGGAGAGRGTGEGTGARSTGGGNSSAVGGRGNGTSIGSGARGDAGTGSGQTGSAGGMGSGGIAGGGAMGDGATDSGAADGGATGGSISGGGMAGGGMAGGGMAGGGMAGGGMAGGGMAGGGMAGGGMAGGADGGADGGAADPAESASTTPAEAASQDPVSGFPDLASSGDASSANAPSDQSGAGESATSSSDDASEGGAPLADAGDEGSAGAGADTGSSAGSTAAAGGSSAEAASTSGGAPPGGEIAGAVQSGATTATGDAGNVSQAESTPTEPGVEGASASETAAAGGGNEAPSASTSTPQTAIAQTPPDVTPAPTPPPPAAEQPPDLATTSAPVVDTGRMSLGGLMSQERALQSDLEQVGLQLDALAQGRMSLDQMSPGARAALAEQVEKVDAFVNRIDPEHLVKHEADMEASLKDVEEMSGRIEQWSKDASMDGTVANLWGAVYTLGGAVGVVTAGMDAFNVPGGKALNATLGLSEAATTGVTTAADYVRTQSPGGPGSPGAGGGSSGVSAGGSAGAGSAQTSGSTTNTGASLPGALERADTAAAANPHYGLLKSQLGTIASANSMDEALAKDLHKDLKGYTALDSKVLKQASNVNAALGTAGALVDFNGAQQRALDAINKGDYYAATQQSLVTSAAALKFATGGVGTSQWLAEVGGAAAAAKNFEQLGNRIGWAGGAADIAERSAQVMEGVRMVTEGVNDKRRLDQINSSMLQQGRRFEGRIAANIHASRRLRERHAYMQDPRTRQLIEQIRAFRRGALPAPSIETP